MINLKTMIALTIIALVFFTGLTMVQSNKTDASYLTNEKYDIEVEINGLHCSMCVRNCERSLEKLDQVDKAAVKLDEGLALIQLKAGQAITKEIITEAVEKAGFIVGEFKKFPGE